MGRSLLLQESQPETMEAARRHFEAALKLDPNYAPALAGISQVEQAYYRDFESTPIHLQRAEQYANQALAVDPDLPEAHIALGRVYGARYKYADAAREFRRAAETEPENAAAWDLLSWELAYEIPPQAAEAEKTAREALRLNPSVPYSQYHLGRALYLQNRYPEAMAAFDRCEELAGNSDTANLGRAQVLAAQRRYPEALALIQKRPLKTATDFYWLSSIYAGNGDQDKALSNLQKALDLGYADFPAIDGNPAFASLREVARFQQLLRRYSK